MNEGAAPFVHSVCAGIYLRVILCPADQHICPFSSAPNRPFFHGRGRCSSQRACAMLRGVLQVGGRDGHWPVRVAPWWTAGVLVLLIAILAQHGTAMDITPNEKLRAMLHEQEFAFLSTTPMETGVELYRRNETMRRRTWDSTLQELAKSDAGLEPFGWEASVWDPFNVVLLALMKNGTQVLCVSHHVDSGNITYFGVAGDARVLGSPIIAGLTMMNKTYTVVGYAHGNEDAAIFFEMSIPHSRLVPFAPYETRIPKIVSDQSVLQFWCNVSVIATHDTFAQISMLAFDPFFHVLLVAEAIDDRIVLSGLDIERVLNQSDTVTTVFRRDFPLLYLHSMQCDPFYKDCFVVGLGTTCADAWICWKTIAVDASNGNITAERPLESLDNRAVLAQVSTFDELQAKSVFVSTSLDAIWNNTEATDAMRLEEANAESFEVIQEFSNHTWMAYLDTMDGQHLQDVHVALKIVPKFYWTNILVASTRGGHMITVVGENFSPSGYMACRFLDIQSLDEYYGEMVYFNRTFGLCETPRMPMSLDTYMQLTSIGGVLSDEAFLFRFFGASAACARTWTHPWGRSAEQVSRVRLLKRQRRRQDFGRSPLPDPDLCHLLRN